MTNQRIPAWLWVSLAATIVLSLYSISKRYALESSNRATSLAAEYDVVEALSAAEGRSVPMVLDNLKAQGIRMLVLSEDTIGELTASGLCEIVPEGSGWKIQSPDPNVLQRIDKGLRIRFQDLMANHRVSSTGLQLPPLSINLIRSTSVGLDPSNVAIARAADMHIIGRFSNPAGISAKGVRETLQWAKELGANVYLPQGEQVLGRRKATDALIQALKDLGIYYASPEFVKIGGDSEVVENAPDQVIRLHSAQAAELDKLSPIDAIDRYVKAARERQMRILLLRPTSYGAEKPLTEFADFAHDVSREIVHEDGAIGDPRPFSDSGIPRPFFVLLGFAIAPMAWFAGSCFASNRAVRIAGAVLISLLALACMVKAGQGLMALVGSIAFPIVGFVLLEHLRPRNILVAFGLVSLFSLAGGLSVAGMLNGLNYFVKADEFPMVKLSVFLPIVAVGIYYWMHLTDWRSALKDPITWGMAVLSLVIVATLALMMARTGNDSGVGASGFEIAFRNLLDRVLYVRPRTKEFMIGHPILVVAIWLLIQRSKQASENVRANGWIVLLIMLGAIGQTSVVNTMCHLHIPVILSLARIVEGLVIGCIIGLAVVAFLKPIRGLRSS